MEPTNNTFDPLTARGIKLQGEYFADCNLLVDIIAKDTEAYKELERERNELVAQVDRLQKIPYTKTRAEFMESWGVDGMSADKKRLANAAWDRAEWFFNQQAEAQYRGLAARVDLLRSEFPLFNDDGLCEYEHHCEFTLLQERKRLHKILSEITPAALTAQMAEWQAVGAMAAWLELKRMGMAQAGSKNVIRSLVFKLHKHTQEAGNE